MKIIILIEIILHELVLSFQSKIISEPYVHFIYSYTFRLQFSYSTYRKLVEINMASDYLWFSQVGYEITRDPSLNHIKAINMTLGNKTAIGDLYTLNFKFGGKSIQKFPLVILKQYQSGYYESFPLSYKYRNESLSVIHYLYNNQYISNLGFCFDTSIEGKRGLLHVGGVPDNLLEENPYKASCNVLQGYSTWGCELNKVIINNKVIYTNKEYSYFQSNSDKILIPLSFYNFLFENIFSKLDQYSDCPFEKQEDFYRFRCKCEALPIDFTLSFQFKGVVVSFTKQEMTYDFIGGCFLRILDNKLNTNEWILGIPFITKHVLYFDYENSIISFYSKTPFPIAPNNDYTTLIKITYINISLLNIALIILLVIYKYK